MAYGTPKEPDDYGSNQDAAAIALEGWPKNNGSLGRAGEWNDISMANELYFVVEYDISSIPSTPETPTGLNNLCQDAENTLYSVNAVEQATSYEWIINPTEAGSVLGNGKSIYVNWNASFNGTAELKVLAKNILGASSYSNTLSITVKPKVAKCDMPSGTTKICNSDGTTEYTINGLSGVDTYEWSIMPKEAGAITGTGKKAIVSWTKNYVGQAKIFVAGTNDCGKGNDSDWLTVILDVKPTITSKPNGSTSLKLNSTLTEYTFGLMSNAKSYTWKLHPESAGKIIKDTIIGNNAVIMIDWTEHFAGDVEISIKAINDCGESDYSESLKIKILEIPDVPEKPTGEAKVCQGTTESTFQTKGAGKNENYIWSLNPNNAGSISGNNKNAIIKWNKSFNGKAEVSVATKGMYGNSENSEKFIVEISPLPEKATSPTGEISLCKGVKSSIYEAIIKNNDYKINWKLVPENVGKLTTESNKCTIEWNYDFSGLAELSLNYSNDCGEGEYSESLKIIVNAPPKTPSVPNGITSIKQGQTTSSEYAIEEVENTKNYNWIIEPTTAGTILPNKNKVTINWDSKFFGKVNLQVKAINDCGESGLSKSLEINIAEASSVEIHDTKSIDIYPNPSNSIIYLNITNDEYFTDLSLFNYDGNLIENFKIDSDNTNSMTINTENYISGQYFFMVKTNLNIYRKSFVIVK